MSNKELEFCSYVEQVYRLTGDLPTYEKVKANLGLVGRGEYDRFWGSKRVRTYLTGIGISLDRIDNSDALNPLQLLAINAILDFNDPKPDHKKLKELGISSRVFSLWKRDPAFSAYLRKRVEAIVGTDDDEIARSLFERARDGDVTAIKFYYEITGKYREKSNGQQQDVRFLVLKVMEVLVRHLQDQPELMYQIGLELEVLSNTVGSNEPAVITNALVINDPVGDSSPRAQLGF